MKENLCCCPLFDKVVHPHFLNKFSNDTDTDLINPVTMQSRYKNYQHIYTDGSKEDSKVGCAVISDNHSNMQRIPDNNRP